ncbi:MAG: PD40 domain-containing protein [Anaerolinea sp.]|nr:PD40 domain-containing protein [Anaerolinea sp.]
MRKIGLLCVIFAWAVVHLGFSVQAQGVSAEIILTIDRPAGPLGTVVSLSPDGSQFMYYERGSENTLCFYTLDNVQQKCAAWLSREEPRNPEASSFVWSPDSKYVVFHTDLLRTLQDSDIWIVEASTGTLTNLTDDGFTGSLMRTKDNFWFDYAGVWSPDGAHIYFLRNAIKEGRPDGGVMLYRVPAGGGEATKVLDVTIPLVPVEAFSTLRLALSPDGKKIAVDYSPRNDDYKGGVFISSLEGDQPAFVRISEQAPPLYPNRVSFSADGKYVLVQNGNIQYGTMRKDDPDPALVANVDSTPGVPLSESGYSFGAGWSSEGSALIYVVRNPLQTELEGLYYKESPDAKGQMILPGAFIAPDPMSLVLVWAANDHLILSSVKSEFYVVKLSR